MGYPSSYSCIQEQQNNFEIIVQKGDISQCMIFGDYYNNISTPFMVVTSFEDTNSEVV